MSKIAHELPAPTAGFEHINRYWDRQLNVAAAKILPGQFYVSSHGEMIVTVLGSCISACIRDKMIGVGGMNHFMLPVQRDASESWDAGQAGSAARYGNWAMEYLINSILSLGGRKNNMEVKVFGGGNVLANMTNVGERNIAFVLEYLQQENLSIHSQDLGDTYPRKVLYFPDTGSVKMKKLRNVHNDTIEKREKAYIDSIEEKPAEGDVELF